MDEQKMIEIDYDEMSEPEITVLLIMSEEPTMRTRLQKISLLYHKLYDPEGNETGHGAYLFGGYSDAIDESAINLADKGILTEEDGGYLLTSYGKKLRDYFEKEYCNEELMVRIENIKKAVSKIPDRNLVGLTYHFYEETTRNSTIRVSVNKLNKSSHYDGLPLSDYPRKQFEQKLRDGIEIKETSHGQEVRGN